MKAISFLGTGTYQETRYVHGDVGVTTKFFAVALQEFFKDMEKTYVLMTGTVQRNPNCTELQDLLGERMEIVSIPESHSIDDLWAIFNTLTDIVQPGDEVVFDITHGYRSLPFIAFLAAAFLRTARGVHVRHVLYGAFEAKKDGITPVFDLTPFVTLIDWVTATNQFVKTGDARDLAGMLRHSEQAESDDRNVAAKSLEQISLSAFLCQPWILSPEARLVTGKLERAGRSGGEDAPFEVLRERVADTFGSFGADKNAPLDEQLRAQFRQLEWYMKNSQIIQAATLAREWLISAVTWRLNLPLDLKSAKRKEMEWAVSGIERVETKQCKDDQGVKRPCTRDDLNAYGQRIYDTWDDWRELKFIWSRVTTARNALDHAGYQDNRMELEKIVDTMKAGMDRLRTLAVAWGLAGDAHTTTPDAAIGSNPTP